LIKGQNITNSHDCSRNCKRKQRNYFHQPLAREILAKGFSAIRKLEDHALLDIMRSYLDGAILRPVEQGHQGSVKDLAVKFLILVLLARFCQGDGL
jgi:hypothetical protein